MDRATTWSRRLGLALVGAGIATAALAAPVSARESVDVSTLNPPPADFKNPVCAWSGRQVICTMEYDLTVRDAPTGIQCAGGEMLESSDRHNTEQRFFNADLDITENRAHEWIEGILFVPETGASVRWTGTDSGTTVYSIPGDRSTGVATNQGAGIHLYLKDGRSISLAGRTIEDLDTGDFRQVGSSRGYDLCDALQ
jgi:hypothetical protein